MGSHIDCSGQWINEPQSKQIGTERQDNKKSRINNYNLDKLDTIISISYLPFEIESDIASTKGTVELLDQVN